MELFSIRIQRTFQLVSTEQNRSDNDYIKKPFAFLRSVCDERTFSFYLVNLLKEYCFIE